MTDDDRPYFWHRRERRTDWQPPPALVRAGSALSMVSSSKSTPRMCCGRSLACTDPCGGAGRVGTVHELACFLSPLVVDVVLPVLMQQQASAVLVSLQWRCHRFSSSMSWGFSLGLVGVHCQVVDVPVVRQRQVPTAFRVPLRVWKRSAYFLRAVSRYSHLDPGHYSIELLVSGMHSATGFSRQSMVAFGRISGKIYVVSAPNQSAHGNLDATSTSLVGWSHIPVQFPEAFGRMSDFFCVLGLLGSCDRSTSCSPWCSLSRG